MIGRTWFIINRSGVREVLAGGKGLTFWRKDNYVVDCGKVAERLGCNGINMLKQSSLIRN